jgi:Fe2+ or Zn2+ uptake regulation protein
VHATNGTARYDGELAPHQHLVCRCYGCVSDLEDGVLSQLRLAAVCSSGLVAEELEIRIVGICPGCGGSERNPAGSSKNKETGRRSVSRKKEKSLWLS